MAFDIDWEISYPQLKTLHKFLILYSEHFDWLITLISKYNQKQNTDFKISEFLENFYTKNIIENIPNAKTKKLPNKTPHEQLWYYEDEIKSEKYLSSKYRYDFWENNFPDLFRFREIPKYKKLKQKDKWKEIYTTLWTIPSTVKEILLKIDISKNTSTLEIMKNIVIPKIEKTLISLPHEIIDDILHHMENYINKMKFVDEYYQQFKNNPKKLLAKIRWIKEDDIKWEDQIYNQDIKIPDTRFIYYSERRHAQLEKVAMVLAATNQRAEISQADLFLAHEILKETEMSMPDALGEYGLSPIALSRQKMLEFVQHANGPVRDDILWAMMRRDMRLIDFKAAIADLVNGHKLLKIDTEDGLAFIFNENLAEVFDELTTKRKDGTNVTEII